MYNEELKKRYISYKESTVVIDKFYLQTLFSKTEFREEELHKDICCFTTSEIIDLYKTFNIPVLETLRVIHSQLTVYTRWCLEESLVFDNQNHFEEIKIEQIEKCINKVIIQKKIISREDLLHSLNALANPRDKFILLYLFEIGKSKDFQEMIKVKPSDIKGNTIHFHDGRTAKISDELKLFAELAVMEDYYHTGRRDFPFIDKGYVIKDLPRAEEEKDDFTKGRRIYITVKRAKSKAALSKWVTPNSLVESGKIHMVKMRSKELGMTPEEYIFSSYFSEVEKQYNCKIGKKLFLTKYNEYL